MVSGLEAVADAIMMFEGWKPGSVSYRNRNPGNLRVGSPSDSGGYTIFPDLPTGYSALLRELTSKFTGHNQHGITPTSSLQDLFNVYAPALDNNQPNLYCKFVAQYVSQSLGKTITPDTKLGEIWTQAI